MSFHLRILNNAGTLQHRLSDAFGNTINGLTTFIPGASSAYTNTPVGADASTPFAAGGKISTAQTNAFICGTNGWPSTSGANTQRIGDSNLSASTSINGTATAGISAVASFQSFNVNGVTRNYLNFTFYTSAGATWALTTTNIAASAYIDVVFSGYVSP